MNKWLCIVWALMMQIHGYGVELTTVDKKITVNGKEAIVLALAQNDGTLGLRTKKEALFDVLLKNTMNVPTSIHWHGLILPNGQDGVAFVTQFPIYPGLECQYKFPLVQSGTYWMHSHYGLQEQKLLSAPLIIEDAEDHKLADQEAVLFLADFSFKDPLEIYQELKCSRKGGMMSMKMGTKDLVDVDYDAFLINYRTLENPDSLEVDRGKKVRLRVINGASTTNFFINLGSLKGELIAVDGNRIKPFSASQFEIAVAQRIDIIVTIPHEGDFFPILAQGEGTNKLAGFILRTKEEASSLGFSMHAQKTAGAFTDKQEKELHALFPLAKKTVDRQITLELGGDMSKYIWTINGQVWPETTPPVVERGQRVEVLFKNTTSMSHPMHLHGHVFQVTEINGEAVDGAMRDTVLVMPNATLAIQFDADNPGVWPLHCHLLYHMEAGMFTVLRYKDFVQPLPNK